MPKKLCVFLIVLLWPLAVCARDFAAAPSARWPDSFLARVEALALLQTLNADLLSHDSATATLADWCELHRLASPPRIVAARATDVEKPPSPEQRRELGVTPVDLVRYRRVRLMCGSLVLSEADNWYVPSRLTPEMNRLLDTTDAPFGQVVRDLHFRRRTLSSTLLWHPLPQGWEMDASPARDGTGPARSGTGPVRSGTGELTIPPWLLEHRALLYLPDGTPFSEVVETYTDQVLGFRFQPR